MLLNILFLFCTTDFCVKEVTAVIPITVFFDKPTLAYFDRFYVPPDMPTAADGLYKLSHFLITSFSDLNRKLINHGVQVRAIIKDNLISNLNKVSNEDNNSDLTDFCSLRSPAESSMKYFESLQFKQPEYMPGNFMLINYCSHMSVSTSTSSYTSKKCNNVIAFRLENIDQFYKDLIGEIPKMLSKVRDTGRDIFENNTFHQELCTYVRTCVESTSKSVGYFVEGVHLINDAGELKSLERKNNFSA
ncbi:hypothetical protein DMUE_4243 [Dictyocoela muelleri]|nr:hypothetical protein DMUE_4243 [Dictyocoela muelleri]